MFKLTPNALHPTPAHHVRQRTEPPARLSAVAGCCYVVQTPSTRHAVMLLAPAAPLPANHPPPRPRSYDAHQTPCQQTPRCPALHSPTCLSVGDCFLTRRSHTVPRSPRSSEPRRASAHVQVPRNNRRVWLTSLPRPPDGCQSGSLSRATLAVGLVVALAPLASLVGASLAHVAYETRFIKRTQRV